ncbi:hypothetical protein GCM10009113_32530 [Marinobacter szutsaonensis]
MQRLNEVVVLANRERLRVRQRGLQFAGELVDSHVSVSLIQLADIWRTLWRFGYIQIALHLNVGAAGGTSSSGDLILVGN